MRHSRPPGRLDSVYVAYWSLLDPLTRSQSLPVVLALAQAGYRMGLMTYEQEPWIHQAPALAQRKQELAAVGVTWIPRTYHKRPALLSTGFDLVAGALRARMAGARMVHGRASVAAAIAYLASRGSGALFLNDADGPLSEEYVDARVWRHGSPGHRATAWMEARCFRAADASAVLTRARADDVSMAGLGSPIVLPCCVDTALFRPHSEEAASLRAELGLAGRVFVYAGKFGGWYMVEQMIDFVRAYRRLFGSGALLVLSTEDPSPFTRAADTRGVPCVVRKVDRLQMPAHLSAADVGLSFILSAPSKRACSPVKNGEYLACGLPVVSTSGIGDYSDLIRRARVGVVVASSEKADMEAGAIELERLLGDQGLSGRCRRTAIENLDLQGVLLPRYLELYARLLGAPTRAQP